MMESSSRPAWLSISFAGLISVICSFSTGILVNWPTIYSELWRNDMIPFDLLGETTDACASPISEPSSDAACEPTRMAGNVTMRTDPLSATLTLCFSKRTIEIITKARIPASLSDLPSGRLSRRTTADVLTLASTSKNGGRCTFGLETIVGDAMLLIYQIL